MEREILAWLAETFPAAPPVELGIGDDAAVIRFAQSQERVVVACDALIDAVHFDLKYHTWERVGRKSIAVNLSDLAAMGARPSAALVALVLPAETSLEQVQALFRGMRDICHAWGLQIIGGDTNFGPGPLVVSVTVLGTLRSNQPAWQTTGAQAGDWLLVSGELGGSLAGKHLDFQPRCALAEFLAQRYPIHAATDISDGLVIDLAKICRRSCVGVELALAEIPIAWAARSHAATATSPLERALYDGEDFELLLACSPDIARQILADPQLPTPLRAIGEFQRPRGIRGRAFDGTVRDLPIRGYSHGAAQ